jgi:TetR/AcrR family transcriptional regulator, regulator of cefoperazone and chloramphenicol sensitivity
MSEHRDSWDDRCRGLVEAAVHVVAEHGFEGLRTRAVASRARCNVATLHYYFPSKDALVQAMTEYLSGQFRTIHAPGDRMPGDARALLRREFEDASYYQVRHRELIVAMLELALRALRDAGAARMLDRALTGWRESLRRILGAGMEAGEIRADVDADAAAAMIAAMLMGLALMARSRRDIERVCTELLRWLEANPPRGGLRAARASTRAARAVRRGGARTQAERNRGTRASGGNDQ